MRETSLVGAEEVCQEGSLELYNTARSGSAGTKTTDLLVVLMLMQAVLCVLLLLCAPPVCPPSCICVSPAGSGYTGSYIFSQTIFSMRAGVAHWSHGAIIAALEGAIFLLPFSGTVGRPFGCWLGWSLRIEARWRMFQ